MTTKQDIKQELIIKAPRSKVWNVLTTAEGWTGWFSEGVKGNFTVGETLGVELTERLEGTLAATALAAADGARMFRVHEVASTRRVLEMVASIQGTRPPTRTVRGLA